MEIIVCSLNYALQPPLEKEQLLVTALCWQEVLEPIIPEGELTAVMNEAVTSGVYISTINLQVLIRTFRERQARNPGGFVSAEQLDQMEKDYWKKHDAKQ